MLASFRGSFDASFAEPLAAMVEREDLLLVRAGALRLAFRVPELAGLEARRKIVPVPGAPPLLLGLAGVRGRLVTVFALAGVLGSEATNEDGRWIAVGAGAHDIGFAFAEIEGRTTVPSSGLASARPDTARGHVHALVEAGAVVRGIVDLRSVLAIVTHETKESIT
jgi:chemotaxis signal transduction protein